MLAAHNHAEVPGTILNRQPQKTVLSVRPLVSIITPVYNGAKTLEQTIKSVIFQNYAPIEFFVMDGGSTDGTQEIIRKYASQITFWRSEKDDGMYEAINKGLKMASGDILAYLNADDLYYPETISTIVRHFESNPRSMIIYGNWNFIDSDGNFLYSYRCPSFNWSRFAVLDWSYIPQPTTFWRKEVHEKIGFFDPEFKMAGDFDFFIRAGRYFWFDHIKTPLAKIRIHKESLSYLKQDLNLREIQLIRQKNNMTNNFRIKFRRLISTLQLKLLNIPVFLRRFLSPTNQFNK